MSVFRESNEMLREEVTSYGSKQGFGKARKNWNEGCLSPESL